MATHTADDEADVSTPTSSVPGTPPEDNDGGLDQIEDVTEETLRRGVTGYGITEATRPKSKADPRTR